MDPRALVLLAALLLPALPPEATANSPSLPPVRFAAELMDAPLVGEWVELRATYEWGEARERPARVVLVTPAWVARSDDAPWEARARAGAPDGHAWMVRATRPGLWSAALQEVDAEGRPGASYRVLLAWSDEGDGGAGTDPGAFLRGAALRAEVAARLLPEGDAEVTLAVRPDAPWARFAEVDASLHAVGGSYGPSRRASWKGPLAEAPPLAVRMPLDDADQAAAQHTAQAILRFEGPAAEAPMNVGFESFGHVFGRDGDGLREVESYSTVLEAQPEPPREGLRAVPAPSLGAGLLLAALLAAGRPWQRGWGRRGTRP